MLVMVVAAVGEHRIQSPKGSSTLAAHWRHRLLQRDELGDVAAVTAGERADEWNPAAVGDQMVLAARPAPANRVSSPLGPSPQGSTELVGVMSRG